MTAEQVALSNHSTIDTSAFLADDFDLSAGHITFNVGTFSATDSAILALGRWPRDGGAVTIQGLQGSGTFAHAVSSRTPRSPPQVAALRVEVGANPPPG